MSYLEGVPFRVTVSFVDDPVGDANLADQPEIELPECAEVLMCTMVNRLVAVIPFNYYTDGPFTSSEKKPSPSSYT